ncbi:hypothetical protein BO70DRAFT_350378 [Aspergillus heteromorphus CBS 117.55]|uniref:Hydrophobin n=1 Tax=Aspergillus heteromorphus CBS 117.55 TaxID=1448321 RepID=A0A317WSS4_9EURO|nr:uncharacterized protein BO70DRAFT_350378 [Aspergillus heteromorphus CBS 117.55]PWY89145.1 hypothetical protein BO70DRAFT_350378 [Aspergillus heteromorphus CBS 117.55]
MQLTTALSILAIATTAFASPAPQGSSSAEAQAAQVANSESGSSTSEGTVPQSSCIPPVLCCGSLTTPLDPLLDPILSDLDIDASSIVGSVGLACKTYDTSCTSAPQCCSEVNLLNGLLALGCSAMEQ